MGFTFLVLPFWCWFTEAHTHTNTQLFYSSLDFVRDNPYEPVPEETFNHSYLLWSSGMPYELSPPITIHDILPVQSTSLIVLLHNLSAGFLWSTCWPGTLNFILVHFFIQLLSSFFNTCLYHHNLFCCSIEIMSSNPTLSIKFLLGTLWVYVCVSVCVCTCMHADLFERPVFSLSCFHCFYTKYLFCCTHTNPSLANVLSCAGLRTALLVIFSLLFRINMTALSVTLTKMSVAHVMEYACYCNRPISLDSQC